MVSLARLRVSLVLAVATTKLLVDDPCFLKEESMVVGEKETNFFDNFSQHIRT